MLFTGKFGSSVLSALLGTQGRIAAALVALAAAFSSGPSSAAVITQWNFNTTVGANNSPAPSTGSGTATIIGMNGGPTGDILLAYAGAASLSPLSSDPVGSATTGDAWRVRGVTSNGYSTSNLTSGAKYAVSTVGFNDVTVSMDVYATGGAPRYAQFEYTTDGTNFVALGTPTDLRLNTQVTGGSYPEGWANGLTFDLSAIPGASNNPNFAIEVVTAFSPVAFTDANGVNHGANTAFQRTDLDPTKAYDPTKGNIRFDMVTVSGTAVPEPSSVVLAGLGALAMGLAYRRQRRANVA